jgi:uncharacterized membrane protein YhaH (DUF805 family)
MSFTEAVRSCLRQYATFSGRARRSEYWWFVLASVLTMIAGFVLLALLAGLINYLTDSTAADVISTVLGVIALIGYAALIIPSLAVSIRRLHDIGRSGWWWWLGLVPLGSFVLLVFACLDSGPDNSYGPSPKAYARADLGPSDQR